MFTRGNVLVWNRFFRCGFTVAAVAFLLLSRGTAQPNENIVVAYSGVSAFQGPLWTFFELKLFPKYNLKPEIVLIAGGTQSMQALLSNYIHFALASATPPLSVGLQGGAVVMIGAALNKFPFSLVTQKGDRSSFQACGEKNRNRQLRRIQRAGRGLGFEGMGHPSSGGDSDPQRRHREPADCPREPKSRLNFIVDAVYD